MFLAAGLAKAQCLCPLLPFFYGPDALLCRAVRHWIPAKGVRE
jgi:hypothetical protein